MGFFSKSKPSFSAPPPPQYKTAQDLFAQAIAFAQANFPLAYGSREGALADLAKGTDYYASFAPTSFEEALGNQYFKNVYPDAEKSIRGALSLSGLDSSTVLADKLGQARGDIGYDVGRYLSDLGNQRAQYSLSNRLAIAPEAAYGTYLQTDLGQSNLQTEGNYQAALQQAMVDYQNAYQKYESDMALQGMIGSLVGAGIGSFAGPGGASIGAGLGGSLFGGSGGGPISFQDSIGLANSFGGKGWGDLFGGGGNLKYAGSGSFSNTSPYSMPNFGSFGTPVGGSSNTFSTWGF